MSEEMMYELESLRKAIRNEPDYALRRVLAENEYRYGWALFSLGSNVSYDDSVPHSYNEQSGCFYIFIWSEESEERYAHRKTGRYFEMAHLESDVTAVRWALDLAGKWTPEPEQSEPVNNAVEEFDMPF